MRSSFYWFCGLGILFRILLRTVLVAAVAAGTSFETIVWRAWPIACCNVSIKSVVDFCGLSHKIRIPAMLTNPDCGNADLPFYGIVWECFSWRIREFVFSM